MKRTRETLYLASHGADIRSHNEPNMNWDETMGLFVMPWNFRTPCWMVLTIKAFRYAERDSYFPAPEHHITQHRFLEESPLTSASFPQTRPPGLESSRDLG